MSTVRILVVDDEPDICEILTFNLQREGFEALSVPSAEEALQLFRHGQDFSLLLLDVMMERMSGYDLARQLRASGINTPIIFLTALSAEADQLEGFSSGADDFISKPFSFPTVLARIRAVLKRTTGSDSSDKSILQCGGISIDMAHKVVTMDGQRLTLTKKEFGILELLMRHAGQHFSREAILDSVWDDDTLVNERSVDVHIARLRKKLGPHSNAIVNHSGFGYTFIS
ncbi:MAG: response regulator transcription factor [Bacteroidales bacterium]|nr:response regulator transcription factor [Bacteroidales bacterium]